MVAVVDMLKVEQLRMPSEMLHMLLEQQISWMAGTVILFCCSVYIIDIIVLMIYITKSCWVGSLNLSELR